jgi:DNA processing protein
MFDSLGVGDRRHEHVAVLALVAAGARQRLQWYTVATLVEGAGSAVRILRREWNGFEPFDVADAEKLVEAVLTEDIARYERLLQEQDSQSASFVTVLDEEYPLNLRQVYNRPPFLFIKGSLTLEDNRSIAIVGTRQPSEDGLKLAYDLASELSGRGVTVLSGLAVGIDTASHVGALEAGGRTVAVLGHGIGRIYPSDNAELAERIVLKGALVSQFWPDAPPTRYSFPMRNVVSSGMAVGTVVIEASSTSGAKNQARLALDHGKHLFLVRPLVLTQDWARKYSEHPRATVIDSPAEIIDVLVRLAQPVRQLTLG